MNNLSPEEILREKEKAGGLEFDDNIAIPIEDVKENVYNTNNKEDHTKLDGLKEQVSENRPMNIGWKNLPMHIIPSKGEFYPLGTQIAIRPAEVREIRLYSMIDEDDSLDIDEKLNLILDECARIRFGESAVVSYLDLKKEDRFFIVMAIRDLTFINGENRIIIETEKKCTTDGCEGMEAIELRTGVLSNYELDENIREHYSPIERNLSFTIKKYNKTIKMTIPSIGVSKAVANFIKFAVRNNIDADESFIKIAPYYFDEWRGLTNEVILDEMKRSIEWSKEEFSAYLILSEKIKLGTKLKVKVKCDRCSVGEVTAPIYFPSGFRSLFVISDIFGELF